jgi:hypothetical protein
VVSVRDLFAGDCHQDAVWKSIALALVTACGHGGGATAPDAAAPDGVVCVENVDYGWARAVRYFLHDLMPVV